MLAEHPRRTLGVNPSSTATVLCVDLDGTLVQTDTLLEAILRLLKREPRMLFALLFWLLKGRSYLKRKVAARVNLDPAELPYCVELISYLQTEREAGARIVLVTGADQRIAQSVADHLGIFDEVIASNGIRNLTGVAKMRELVARFGSRKFRYVGNSRTDLPVWREASHTLVCGASGPLLRRLNRERIPTERVFLPRKNTFTLLAQAMRVYQWPKNLLILVPLCLSHRIGELSLIAKGLTAMAAFSLCASSLYLINDLLDLAADRAHPRKSTRPFASGRLSLATGILLAPCLVAVALLLASFLPIEFLLILVAYGILSTAYSFFFKEIPLLDICLLGGLYVVRIFAGGSAMGIVISSWTLGYCMFLFLSLAMLKRYTELLMLNANKQTAAPGRGYVVADFPILACFGAGSASVAALLLALYIESEEVQLLYRYPQRLWFLCGMHMYWISRAWLLANRGEMHHDPVLFALKDRASYWLGLLAAVVVVLAT
jgi:4-hydroxybenzoate polyprenyltransferase/phosphoserine phosphatase